MNTDIPIIRCWKLSDMGLLVEGVWEADDGKWASKDGWFRRAESQFRNSIGTDAFPAEAGRYHLYVCLACPWAHRVLIFRKIKGLENLIGVTTMHPHMLENGWEFNSEADPLYAFRHLHQLYTKADAHYSGRVSVPVLWDRQRETIVNNESSEIIRMFNSAFDGMTGNDANVYPHELRAEIDEVNTFIYDGINNGVYRCGFATAQDAYEKAFDMLFAALDAIEARLTGREYLVGDLLTEADIRLYTTLIRFDVVYFSHFKCNRNRIADMPHLSAYLKRLYAIPAFCSTTDFDHIKQHYYYSHESINPTRIVPKGPKLDFDVPHGCGKGLKYSGT